MTASSTDTVFAGGDGNDTLNGGAGADRLYGDAGNDTLNGGNGVDILDGGAGNDTMVGGAGNDSYYVDSSSDVVTEVSGQGSDTVYSSAANYTVGANIEYTYLTGTANNNLTGDSVTNYLYGNAGNNVLNGGGGADALYGGAGDDTYYVDNTGDVAGENGNEGRDLVIAAVTFTLATFFEDLTLTGSANINGTGNTLANTITGNGGINQLNGGDGSDTLYGGGGNDVLTGGTGADTMYGGSGDDTFYVDNAGDVVSENASEGTDTVITSIGYSIATSAQVENLTITGSAGISVTGNALGNTIMGGTGADTINGGAGADTMSGGAGNDTYVVDNAGDVVTELSNQGFDTVQSSITYTAPTNVENITLTGSSAINATGNTLANVLVGNSGANQLKGGGAADNLTGGGGADIFVFAATSDSTGSARDTIADFLSGTDKIDLSGIDANTALAGDQAFTFIGGSAFSDVAGQLQYANGMLGGDVNGDGIPDFAITITNSPSIVAADLIA